MRVSTLFSACVVVTFAVSSIHCAVEISQSTVDSGIFGWEQSYAILFDDFLCDVVNPLLPPDERFEECGGTFALNPDGIGILPEQVDQATRTITTERFEERTKYGSSSEETTSIEGEMPSTEAQKLQKKLQEEETMRLENEISKQRKELEASEVIIKSQEQRILKSLEDKKQLEQNVYYLQQKMNSESEQEKKVREEQQKELVRLNAVITEQRNDLNWEFTKRKQAEKKLDELSAKQDEVRESASQSLQQQQLLLQREIEKQRSELRDKDLRIARQQDTINSQNEERARLANELLKKQQQQPLQQQQKPPTTQTPAPTPSQTPSPEIVNNNNNNKNNNKKSNEPLEIIWQAL